MIEDIEQCSALVSTRQSFNSSKYLALQKSLNELSLMSRQLKKSAEDAPQGFGPVDSLDQLMECVEKENGRLKSQLEKETSRAKFKEQYGYRVMMSQAEACLREEVKDIDLQIDEEKLVQEEIDAAYFKITTADEQLKVRPSTCLRY
jgi:hypothetical protein